LGAVAKSKLIRCLVKCDHRLQIRHLEDAEVRRMSARTWSSPNRIMTICEHRAKRPRIVIEFTSSE
jgi:hypothetical protein